MSVAFTVMLSVNANSTSLCTDSSCGQHNLRDWTMY